MESLTPKNTDAYSFTFPETIRERLLQIWATIKHYAPDAEEMISYAIPTGHKAFEKEFSVYKTGKGSVQFPLHKAL